jgi:hypothetical protein
MPGFNTIPGSSGGGGQPNMTFVASIHMSTYNRSWAQGGTAGNYGIYSANQEAGYAYFVGSGTTTGVPLNRMSSVGHSFTRIDIIAPTNDMVSLYKVKVKSTTEFLNPFALFSSFLYSTQSSSSFVLPSAALPLVNLLIAGGGGGSGRHGGGGGAGGSVVKLTALTAVGTTAIQIGAGTSYQSGATGGTSFFGSLYALGGGHGGNHNSVGGSGGNGGGGGGHGGSASGGTGTVQTGQTGLGFAASPELFGGFNGAAAGGEPGGGGAGAGGSASASVSTHSRQGGAGHTSDIGGSSQLYGVGGGGGRHNEAPGSHGGSGWPGVYSHGGHGGSGDSNGGLSETNTKGTGGATGIVHVRYYIA